MSETELTHWGTEVLNHLWLKVVNRSLNASSCQSEGSALCACVDMHHCVWKNLHLCTYIYVYICTGLWHLTLAAIFYS